MPLQGIQEVVKHFSNFRDIPQINQLAAEVSMILYVFSGGLENMHVQCENGKDAIQIMARTLIVISRDRITRHLPDELLYGQAPKNEI